MNMNDIAGFSVFRGLLCQKEKANSRKLMSECLFFDVEPSLTNLNAAGGIMALK